MFTDQNETKDWLFGIAAVVAVIIVFLFIRQHREVQYEAEQAAAAVATPSREPKTTYVVEYRQSSEPMRISPPKPVYRCSIDGQQVFSDHACAADASVVSINESNRADPQDTTHLYDAVTSQRSQVTSQRGSFSDSGSADPMAFRASQCDSIQSAIDSVNARMRERYSNPEGEYYRDRLRDLKAQQWDLKCRWVKHTN
jgi:hypothetical protein